MPTNNKNKMTVGRGCRSATTVVINQTSDDVKWRVPIFIVKLNDASHRLDSHLVQLHPLASILPMMESLTKNVEALKPCMKSFLAVLSPRQK